MEESMRIDTIKVEVDVSIDNKEDVTGTETDKVCEPQECEPEDEIDTVTVEGVENVGEEDCIKIKTEEDFIQSVWIMETKQENSMDLGETVPSVCSETCLIVCDDGSEVSDARAEEVLHMQEEEDPLAIALPAVEAADKNCVGFVEGETGSCSETDVECGVDGTEEVYIKSEEFIDVKEEVSIKVEGAIDIQDEIPEAISFPPFETESEGPLDEHHVLGAECGYSCNMQRGERPYSCEMCNKVFNQKCNLIRHQRLHSGERPYSCEVCNKAFSNKSNLTTHQRIHSGERPYVCNVCNKAFIENKALKRHQRIHSGERPYTCEMCNKAFNVKSTLITHRRIHSGEHPYTCEVCNKVFNQKCNLIRHQRMHSGECRYSCEVCNKVFIQKCNLIAHQRIHSAERPNTCEVCNKTFSRQSLMKTHQCIHSGEHPYV